MIGFFLFFPTALAIRKPCISVSFLQLFPPFSAWLSRERPGHLYLRQPFTLEATLIIVVRSRTTAHETKVKAKLIARARVHHPHHHAGTFPLSYQESFRKSMAAAFGDRALSRKLSLSAPAVAAAVLSSSTERLAAIIPGGQQPRAAAGRPRGKPNLPHKCVRRRCRHQAATNLAVRPQDIPLLTTESWLRGVCTNHQ